MKINLNIVDSSLATLGIVLGIINIKTPDVAWPWFFVSAVSILGLIRTKVYSALMKALVEELKKLKNESK